VGNVARAGLDYDEASGDLYIGGPSSQDGDIVVLDRFFYKQIQLRSETASIVLGTGLRTVADANGCYYA
jgi:hypothetical protein